MHFNSELRAKKRSIYPSKTITRGSNIHILAHIHTETLGIAVECWTNDAGHDVFQVYKTPGTLDPDAANKVFEFVDTGETQWPASLTITDTV